MILYCVKKKIQIQINQTTVAEYTADVNSLFVLQRNVGQILPPGTVHGIRESRMVGVQLGTVRQDLIGVLVQVSDPQREPRYVFCTGHGNWRCKINIQTCYSNDDGQT